MLYFIIGTELAGQLVGAGEALVLAGQTLHPGPVYLRGEEGYRALRHALGSVLQGVEVVNEVAGAGGAVDVAAALLAQAQALQALLGLCLSEVKGWAFEQALVIHQKVAVLALGAG